MDEYEALVEHFKRFNPGVAKKIKGQVASGMPFLAPDTPITSHDPMATFTRQRQALTEMYNPQDYSQYYTDPINRDIPIQMGRWYEGQMGKVDTAEEAERQRLAQEEVLGIANRYKEALTRKTGLEADVLQKGLALDPSLAFKYELLKEIAGKEILEDQDYEVIQRLLKDLGIGEEVAPKYSFGEFTNARAPGGLKVAPKSKPESPQIIREGPQGPGLMDLLSGLGERLRGAEPSLRKLYDAGYSAPIVPPPLPATGQPGPYSMAQPSPTGVGRAFPKTPEDLVGLVMEDAMGQLNVGQTAEAGTIQRPDIPAAPGQENVIERILQKVREWRQRDMQSGPSFGAGFGQRPGY